MKRPPWLCSRLATPAADCHVIAMNKDPIKKKKSSVKCSAHEYMGLFMDHFADESDRASAIVGAAILDYSLESVLKSYFIKSPNKKNDVLFDGPNAPLTSFSAKIDMAFRLGIISEKMSKALHITRRIRNTFAHDIMNCNFANQRVISLIQELRKVIFKNKRLHNRVRPSFPEGPRGDFQMCLSLIVWWLWCGEFLSSIKPLAKRKFEL